MDERGDVQEVRNEGNYGYSEIRNPEHLLTQTGVSTLSTSPSKMEVQITNWVDPKPDNHQDFCFNNSLIFNSTNPFLKPLVQDEEHANNSYVNVVEDVQTLKVGL